MPPRCSKYLSGLPPYLFVKLDSLKEEARRKGLDVIDLGMGNPDRPSPDHVVEALCRSVRENPSTHRYPQTKGARGLREAIALWYSRRFGVELDPEREVLPLLGSKEGLAHLFFAYLGPSDYALIPSPCYPVHYNGAFLTGAKLQLMPLKLENGFLPDLGRIPASAARKAKLLLINYPNNPTGAVVEGVSFFEDCVRFAKRHGCFVVHDNAYSEIAFDGYRAPSFLQAAQAKKYGVEFHSFSKTYSMAGWRVAFAVGNAEILANLCKFKSFLDYGIAGFVQEAAAAALAGPQDCVVRTAEVYSQRRDALAGSLREEGWPVESPRATMYLWAALPDGWRGRGSLAFAEKLIQDEGVVVAPGIGFGPHGEGFVRFALVDESSRIEEAARRIGRFLKTPPPKIAKNGIRPERRPALAEIP